MYEKSDIFYPFENSWDFSNNFSLLSSLSVGNIGIIGMYYALFIKKIHYVSCNFAKMLWETVILSPKLLNAIF